MLAPSLAIACLSLSAVVPPAPEGVRSHREGNVEIVSLLDGGSQLPPDLMHGLSAAELARLAPGPIATSANAFLVRLGKRNVLIDTGFGAGKRPGTGHLVERLAALGVAPESIETILITHCHGDHFGGLLAPDGKRAFPKAVVRLSEAELGYWPDPAVEAKLPENRKTMISALKAAFAPYQAAGDLRPFRPGKDPIEGVSAMPTPGHTPGHTVYVVKTGARPVWFVGDLVHVAVVQFEHPEVTMTFDSDQAAASKVRLEVWRKAAREGAVLAGAHLPFPGLGLVKPSGPAFAWEPLAPDAAAK